MRDQMDKILDKAQKDGMTRIVFGGNGEYLDLTLADPDALNIKDRWELSQRNPAIYEEMQKSGTVIQAFGPEQTVH